MKNDCSSKVLCIIGARSGSKGVPDKNIRVLGGKPLLVWPIEMAKASRFVNRTIVCTDSPQYGEIARAYGAETPFLQPVEVSHDRATEMDFISYALSWLDTHEGYRPDIVVRLFATVPFQTSKDVDACIEKLLDDEDADASVVIAEASQHPHKALKLTEDGHVITYITENGLDVTPLQRQQYQTAYFRQGCPIVTRRETIERFHSLTGERVRYHSVSQRNAFDIDSEDDFFIAEALIEHERRGLYGKK